MNESENPTKKRKWLYRKAPLNENVFLFLLFFVYLLIPVTFMYEIKTINTGNSQVLNYLFSISEFTYYPFKVLIESISNTFLDNGILFNFLLILYPFFPAIIVERLISFLVFFIKLALPRKN